MLNSGHRQALMDFLAAVDAAIAAHAPRCDVSGRCCRFEEFGHTLFLSEFESELLLELPIAADWAFTEANCPYQCNGLCTAREHRPMGCRVYFCDPQFVDQMGQISEAFISRLKRLHVDLGRSWSYRPLHHFLSDHLAQLPAREAPSGPKHELPPHAAIASNSSLISIGLLPPAD